MNNENTIQLLVMSRENVIYKGEVFSLTSVNEKGIFDILPMHANFISLISAKLIIGEKDGNKREIKINNGLLRTNQNKVEVYVGLEGVKQSAV